MASILIVVPKLDEWKAACHEFGLTNPDAEAVRTPLGTRICRFKIAGRSASIALLSQQTNTYSGVLTMELLYRENPRQAFLLGTALGVSFVPVGSVVIAEAIQDITERRPTSENPNGYRPTGNRSPFDVELLEEAEAFIYERFSSEEARMRFFSSLDELPALGATEYVKAREQVLAELPTVSKEPMLSGNEYIMNRAVSNQRKLRGTKYQSIWSALPGNKAYDMEAAGFTLAATGQRIPWLVVRGISDHGTGESKFNRAFATQAAAAFLRDFLCADPSRVSRISSSRPRLAGSLAEKLSGTYWGFMGYLDDHGEPTVYQETVVIHHDSEKASATVKSLLRSGSGVSATLDYRVEILVGASGSFAGVWSPSVDHRGYFGSISGRLNNHSPIEGLWTGTHEEGIRVGRFVWYRDNEMPANAIEDHYTEFLEKIQVAHS